MTDAKPKQRRGASVAINGSALREIRVRTGLRIVDLARDSGVDATYISKIELGYSSKVSPDTYDRINSALCITDYRVLLGRAA